MNEWGVIAMKDKTMIPFKKLCHAVIFSSIVMTIPLIFSQKAEAWRHHNGVTIIYDPYWPHYDYPYYRPYPLGYPYFPPPITVIEQPVIQVTVPPIPAPSPSGEPLQNNPPPSYYYCPDPKGYYPYVKICKTPFQPIPLKPAQSGQ
jgi:hypothetical protein